MTNHKSRTIGEALTPLESELLDILCSGADSASSIARAQRATAVWGGYEFNDCECFLIATNHENETPTIERDGGPFAVALVSDGTESLGTLELWAVDGHLHSVNYIPFSGDHYDLPSPKDFDITLEETAWDNPGTTSIAYE